MLEHLPNAPSLLAISTINIAIIAATGPIANEPICIEKKESQLQRTVIRTGMHCFPN